MVDVVPGSEPAYAFNVGTFDYCGAQRTGCILQSGLRYCVLNWSVLIAFDDIKKKESLHKKMSFNHSRTFFPLARQISRDIASVRWWICTANFRHRSCDCRTPYRCNQTVKAELEWINWDCGNTRCVKSQHVYSFNSLYAHFFNREVSP